MAAYPDDMKMMNDFEAFDRNGAFSQGGGMDERGLQGQMVAPQMGGPMQGQMQGQQMGRPQQQMMGQMGGMQQHGGMPYPGYEDEMMMGMRGGEFEGQFDGTMMGMEYEQQMMQQQQRQGGLSQGGAFDGGMNQGMMGEGGNPNPFARQGEGHGSRMYTRDGFDPYSAYSGSTGAGQSENRRGAAGGQGRMRGGVGEFYGPGLHGGDMNGVHNDNTMCGFSYSSRGTQYGGYGGGEGGEQGQDMSRMGP